MPILNDVISISHYGLDTPKYLEVILKNISNETFTIGTHWCSIATPSPNNKNGPLKVLYSFSGSTEEEKKDSIRVLKVYTFPAQEVRPRGQMICVEFFVVHKVGYHCFHFLKINSKLSQKMISYWQIHTLEELKDYTIALFIK